MEMMFIEGKSNADIKKVIEKSLKLLPKLSNTSEKGLKKQKAFSKTVGIATTAQHKHTLKQAKEILEKNNIQAITAGQVLGCNANNAKKIKNKVDAFLYIGSGRFHPIQIQLETGKKVIMANPLTNEVRTLEKSETEKIKKQQKGALIRFLSSKEIGILVSTKPGQNKLDQALKLKNKLKDKNCYIFLTDTINPAEFENFPFIESWINTACPRFADDKKGVINYEMVQKIL